MASQESYDNYYADKAAQAQLQATRDALAFLKEQWEQQRADQEPWRKMGGGAANKLGYLMGLEGYTTPSLTAVGARAPIGSSGYPPPNDSSMPPGPPTPSGGGGGAPPYDQRDNSYANPLALITGMGGAGGDDMVEVQAPTGERRRMPKSQAQRFVQMGATLIGTA